LVLLQGSKSHPHFSRESLVPQIMEYLQRLLEMYLGLLFVMSGNQNARDTFELLADLQTILAINLLLLVLHSRQLTRMSSNY